MPRRCDAIHPRRTRSGCAAGYLGAVEPTASGPAGSRFSPVGRGQFAVIAVAAAPGSRPAHSERAPAGDSAHQKQWQHAFSCPLRRAAPGPRPLSDTGSTARPKVADVFSSRIGSQARDLRDQRPWCWVDAAGFTMHR